MSSTIAPTLRAYLPAWLAARSRSDPVSLDQATAHPILVAALFADVSGFSALTRSYVAKGGSAVERLTQLISDYHSGLINGISQAGGDIEEIYGDAVLAFWVAVPGDPSAFDQAVRQAVACAKTLVDNFDDYQVGDDLALRLRVAVACGAAQAVQVGGAKDRWKFHLAGDCLLELEPLLELAKAGEVALSAPTWDRVTATCAGRPLDESAVLLQELRQPPPAATPLDHQIGGGQVERLLKFLPTTLRHRLLSPGIGWLAEFRTLTVMFIGLPAIRCGRPDLLPRWQALIQAVQEQLYRYEGSFLRVSMNDKGPMIIAAFGLPHRAHEDDPVRSVLAARDLLADPALGATGARFGLATGPVYCGAIGNDTRRTYTVMGDTVNRAARLMTLAPRPLVLDHATMSAVQHQLHVAPLPALRLKGGQSSVPIYEPKDPRAQIREPTVSVAGRDDELRFLHERLKRLSEAGEAAIVYLDGEPGMGKSTLMRRLCEEAAEDFRIYQGATDPIDRATPYATWKSVFADWLASPQSCGPAALRGRLEGLMTDCGLDPVLTPLVSPVLPEPLADSELTAQMSGEVRAENTRNVLTALLRRQLARKPSLVVLEDAHWMGSASWALLLQVVAEVEGFMLIVTSRPLDAEDKPELRRLLAALKVEPLHLGPLDRDAVGAILRRDLQVETVSPTVVDTIMDRTAGNPFFARELAISLRDSGALEPSNGDGLAGGDAEAIAGIDLPDNLQRAIVARVDRLPPALQLTLKVASVIGRAFSYAELAEIFPFAEQKDQLREHLEVLASFDITRIDSEEPELLCCFNHALTQEAIYGLLLYSQRQTLHGAMAAHLEDRHGAAPGAPFALMAHHWTRAERSDRALPNWERAGSESLSSGAYPEAITALRNALEALDGTAELCADGLYRGRLQRLLGHAHLEIGDLANSQTQLTQGLDSLERHWPKSDLGFTHQLIGQTLRQALQSVRRTRASPQGRAREADSEAARIYEYLGQSAGHSNDVKTMALSTIAALNISQRQEDYAQFSRSAGLFALMLLVIGLTGLSERYITHSRRHRPDLTRPHDRIICNEYIALYLISAGQLSEAQRELDEARDLCRKINDRRRLGDNTSLLAITLMAKGEIERSAELRDQFCAQAEQGGDPQLICWGKLEQAEINLLLGDPTTALEQVAATMPLLAKLGQTEAVWAHGLRARTQLLLDDPAQAIDAALQTIDLMRITPHLGFYAMEGAFGAIEVFLRGLEGQLDGTVGGWHKQSRRALRQSARLARRYPICAVRHHILQGRRDLALGRQRPAETAIRRGLKVARRFQMPYEEALALQYLARLSRDPETRAQHAAQALALYRGLGAKIHIAEITSGAARAS